MTLFHPDAESEYLAAIDYYSAIQNRLAARFADAVETAIARVAREPRRFREIAPGIRLCRVTNFPYTILFSETNRMVLAVKHDRRDPDYWRGRSP
jgi:plasmid stabilization system protein ParE